MQETVRTQCANHVITLEQTRAYPIIAPHLTAF